MQDCVGRQGVRANARVYSKSGKCLERGTQLRLVILSEAKNLGCRPLSHAYHPRFFASLRMTNPDLVSHTLTLNRPCTEELPIDSCLAWCYIVPNRISVFLSGNVAY